jgi:hypothetical protein
MTGRFKLLSAVGGAGIAAAIWGASAGLSVANGPVYGPPCGPEPCSPAAPCSPDGACWPKHDTWGWYPTRWRAFPGDVIGLAPTEAEERREKAPEEALGGPQPPEATEEGQTGPARPERAGSAAGAGGEAPGAAEAPAGLEGAAGEGAAPGPQGAPAEAPQPDLPLGPEDPLGAAPPTPPWLAEPAGPIRLEQPESVQAAEELHDAEVEEASATTPIPAAPNFHQDDAPPALPAGLRQAMGGGAVPLAPLVQGSPAAPISLTLPKSPSSSLLVQPASVRPSAPSAPAADRRIVPASATIDPQAIGVINPAGAIQADPAADGPQQAIYFEASDLE